MWHDVAGGGQARSVVGIRTDQPVGHIAQRGEMQIGLGFGCEQDSKIEGAGQQIKAHLGGIIRFDVKGAIGQAGAELRHPIADKASRQIILDAKPQGDGGITLRADTAARLVPFMAQGAGVRLKPQAFRRKVGACARPGEQAHIESGLQGSDTA